MNDLDRALRTMLQTRSQDITTVPSHLGDLDVDARQVVVDLDGERVHSRPRSAIWLVAASIAAVLAVAGIAIAIGRHDGGHGTPAVTKVPSPTPTATATHVDSRVSLSWFGMADLPGYTSRARESLPGYQWLAVHRNTDTGIPPGCDSCELATAYVYVFDKGAFDASKDGIASGQHVTVNGTSAVLGEAAWYGAPGHRVPSIAWQFRPGQWALVQGVTTLGGTAQSLLAVADAVRPAVAVPIQLPCTFDFLPALPIVDITDDRSEGYAFTLTMGDPQGRSFTIELWNGASWSYYNPSGMNRVTIGGLPGYDGAQAGVGVLYHGGGMTFGFGENLDPGGTTLTPADQAQTHQVIAGIHWANGDGRPPLVAAQRAIP